MHLPNEDTYSNAGLESVFANSVVKSAMKSQRSIGALCPNCLEAGKESVLADYQINFEEAVRLCPEPTCPYPLKEDNVVDSFIFKRDASALTLSKGQNIPVAGRKSRKSSGYSTFFEDFDLDSLLDFSAPSLQNQSMQNLNSDGESYSNTTDVQSIKIKTLSMNEESTFNKTKLDLISKESPEEIVELLSSNEGKPCSDHEAGSSASVESKPESDVIPDIDLVENGISEHNSGNESVEVMDCLNQRSSVDDVVNVNDEINQIDIAQKLSRPFAHSEVLQWVNEDNSCWLDAILQVLVSSMNTRASLNLSNSANNSVLKKIILTYDVCQQAYQIYQTNGENTNEAVVTSLSHKLSRVRSDLLKLLKQNSSFKAGDFQSVLEMLPLVLKSSEASAEIFKVNLIWDFQCEKCGHRRARRSHSNVVSFPRVCSDFHPLNAQFPCLCYECKSPSGLTSILMERLPPCLAFHFQKGLSHSNLRVLDFSVQGFLYSVFAVVRYVMTPFKHFIIWIRDFKTNKWLCCDDLKNPVCKWQSRQPKIPAAEIHMVFWERQSVTDPLSVQPDQICTILNEETAAIADEMPIEIFFAHENDETIVVSEQDDSNDSSIQDQSHSTVVKKYSSFVEKSTVVLPMQHSTQLQQVDRASDVGNQPPGATSINGTPFHFNPSMFVNGGVSVVPGGNQQQAIQVVAPANTCSIYIVTNDSKNQHLLYQGTTGQSQSKRVTRKSSVRSFVDDSVSYSMVSKSYSSSMNHREKKKFASYPQKRQYRLSGYSSFKEKNKFSPIKPSSSKTPRLSEQYLSENFSQCCEKEKPDSEKLSEVSELSDLFPEFDLDSNHSIDSYSSAPAALRCSAITPPITIFNSDLTPTNSPPSLQF